MLPGDDHGRIYHFLKEWLEYMQKIKKREDVDLPLAVGFYREFFIAVSQFASAWSEAKPANNELMKLATAFAAVVDDI